MHGTSPSNAMQVSYFKMVEIVNISTQGGDTTKYRSRRYDNIRRSYNKVPEPPIQQYEAEIQQSTGAADIIMQGGDTTKYRSRRYDDTRRRYNKVPEPPIQQYEAEIQQSTGAANIMIQVYRVDTLRKYRG